MPQLALDLMTLMGIPEDIPRFYVTEPTTVEQLDVPVMGSSTRLGTNPFYRRYLKTYQENIHTAVKSLIEKAPSHLFYSRSHALRDGGVLGISYFEDRLRKKGFVSCVPEEMSLKMQFAYVMAAEKIIFEEGSAIHITDILSSIPGRTYMLRRRPVGDVFSTSLKPRASAFINLVAPDNVQLLPDRSGNMSPACLSFYKRPDAVSESLVKHGFEIGDFDQEAYRKAERRDLNSAVTKSVFSRVCQRLQG
ncbi:hypothetical protein M529_06175 [Sphingobium ummariense RL-3]|uniref:Glycosyltransferase 61 catalytic domain-containing protein n=2 Tax=Sphingobium TaxID=165695 RepID=T0IWD8_9SPHN|nr:hypothetical protein M529_06175 [Sphingobium ummariense RL-3]